MNLKSNIGRLEISIENNKGGSHKYIWNKYSQLKSRNLGLTELTYSNPYYLSVERNIENYSFEGYRQLDFNLADKNFKSYFKRDYIKNQSNLIYTSITALILGVIGELFNLFNELGVRNLPVTKEKLIFMSHYSLGDSEKYKKLKNLITLVFPANNEYIKEYHWYEYNC